MAAHFYLYLHLQPSLEDHTVATTAPDFDQLDDLLQRLGALQTACELHGFLTGQLAGGKRLSRGEWLRTATEQADLSQNPDEVEGDVLLTTYQHTLAELTRSDMGFQLMLPDDDCVLADRVDGLGQWCQGFLLGIGLAGVDADSAEKGDELAETLRDLATIAQIGGDDEGNEDGENDFFAISEYVRMAVIDIFWQCNRDPSPNEESDSESNAEAAPAMSPAQLFKRDTLH